jgi:hypothetical protein
MTTHVDFTLVKEIVTDAMKVIETVDGTDINDTTLGNRPADARLNRTLMNLADQLLLASVLIRNEYWTGKGGMAYDIS